MIIVYYRNKDTGQIVTAHTNRPGQDMAFINQAVEAFNETSASRGSKRIAGAVEVPDDSLEAYLYNHKNDRMQRDKAALQEAIDALYTALEAVRYLED